MATRPPDWQIGPPRRRHRTLWSDLAGIWRGFRRWPLLVQIFIVVVLVILMINLAAILFGNDGGTKVASRSTTTLALPTSSTSTTTTIAPGIPAGDDAAVKTVLDGDSFETASGTKVRLIGLDAPDTETDACYSAEAAKHLEELLPAGRQVRLVYDATRTDRLGRTLAYVFRLPDGLFIDKALLRDGTATLVTTGSLAVNTTYAREFGDAEADAKSAKRGLWGSCSTPVTTRASSGTTATTAEPPEPTSTTPTSAPGTAVVVENEICFLEGQSGVFADGRPAVCRMSDYLRWQAA